jgi:hypothetical protein
MLSPLLGVCRTAVLQMKLSDPQAFADRIACHGWVCNLCRMARIVKSPVVGLVSSFMWSFNSQSQVQPAKLAADAHHEQPCYVAGVMIQGAYINRSRPSEIHCVGVSRAISAARGPLLWQPRIPAAGWHPIWPREPLQVWKQSCHCIINDCLLNWLLSCHARQAQVHSWHAGM